MRDTITQQKTGYTREGTHGQFLTSARACAGALPTLYIHGQSLTSARACSGASLTWYTLIVPLLLPPYTHQKDNKNSPSPSCGSQLFSCCWVGPLVCSRLWGRCGQLAHAFFHSTGCLFALLTAVFAAQSSSVGCHPMCFLLLCNWLPS